MSVTPYSGANHVRTISCVYLQLKYDHYHLPSLFTFPWTNKSRLNETINNYLLQPLRKNGNKTRKFSLRQIINSIIIRWLSCSVISLSNSIISIHATDALWCTVLSLTLRFLFFVFLGFLCFFVFFCVLCFLFSYILFAAAAVVFVVVGNFNRQNGSFEGRSFFS